MYKTMNMKGFLLILGIMLLIFLILHSVLKSTVDEKAEKEKEKGRWKALSSRAGKGILALCRIRCYDVPVKIPVEGAWPRRRFV